MSPAQRKVKRAKKKARNGKKKYLKYLLLLLIPIFFFLLITLQTKYWKASGKTYLVIAGKEKDVIISVFDSELEKITNIIISKNTEVEVARQLGRWKLGSVRELGENEDLEGKLLAETIVKHFKLPVIAWADSPAQGFAEGDLPGIMKASLLPYKTNLGIGDRFKLGLFSLRTKNIKREDINLADNNILKKTILTDGGEGYVLSGRLPNYILALFSYPTISKEGVTAVILDGTGRINVAEEVGEVIEVMGIKVANIKKNEGDDSDCTIKCKDRAMAKEIAEVFSCQVSKELPNGNFDIEITIGSLFLKRF